MSTYGDTRSDEEKRLGAEVDRLRAVIRKALDNTDWCPWCRRESWAGKFEHTHDCAAFREDGAVR